MGGGEGAKGGGGWSVGGITVCLNDIVFNNSMTILLNTLSTKVKK